MDHWPTLRLVRLLGVLLALTLRIPALRAEVSIAIDLHAQQAYLLEGGQILAQSPVSSGRASHPTPSGSFRVLEKDPDHRSSQYGRIIGHNGQVLVRDANANTPVPPGARFVQAPMRYFLRFVGPFGMHAGRLPGYPASHGCVRLPTSKAILFYEQARVGTPIRIAQGPPR